MQPDENDLRERTKRFGLRVLRMFSRLPKTAEAQVLGKQMLRSGTSVGANYREAYRGRSKAEFISKCGDSLRELEETAYWLEPLVDGKVVAAERGRSGPGAWRSHGAGSARENHPCDGK